MFRSEAIHKVSWLPIAGSASPPLCPAKRVVDPTHVAPAHLIILPYVLIGLIEQLLVGVEFVFKERAAEFSLY